MRSDEWFPHIACPLPSEGSQSANLQGNSTQPSKSPIQISMNSFFIKFMLFGYLCLCFEYVFTLSYRKSKQNEYLDCNCMYDEKLLSNYENYCMKYYMTYTVIFPLKNPLH